jgi:amino acid transporter
MIINAGGQYVYIQRAFGTLFFLYGWTVFSNSNWRNCGCCSSFTNYTAVFFPVLEKMTLLV